MSHCYKTTEVKTSTGTFTLHKEEVNKCKAKQICEDKGEVLAPLTKHSDRLQIKQALKFDDDQCNEFWLGKRLHIGIDFEVCDGELYPSTTTGEKISSDLKKNFQMVNLNPNYKAIDTSFVPVSPFNFHQVDDMTMVAWGQAYHNSGKYSFVCLKPAKSTSEPLLSDSPFPKTLFASVGLAFCFAVSTVGLLVAYIKQKRQSAKYKQQLIECKTLGEC